MPPLLFILSKANVGTFASQPQKTPRMTWKRLTYYLLIWSQLCLSVLTFVACKSDPSGDDELPSPSVQELGTYFEVNIRAVQATTTRGPQGGEDGDYTDPGYEREQAVNNATLLIYQDNKGINGSDDTPIIYALYAPTLTRVAHADGSVSYATGLLHQSQPIRMGKYHILVLANMGDQSRWQGHTLGELRADHSLTQLYSQADATDPTSATNFAMAQADDAEVTIEGTGGIENPIQVTANLERLAARIDFCAGGATGGYQDQDLRLTLQNGTVARFHGYYTYVVKGSGTTADNSDVFYLTTVTTYNAQQSGEYLIKRVANSTDDDATTTYLGAETTTALSHQATNYVIDPWTTQKNNSATSIMQYNRRYEDMDALPTAQLTAVKAPDATNKGTDGTTYYTLDYAMENTLMPTSDKRLYATGITLQGYYGKRQADGSLVFTEKRYHYFIRHSDPNNSSAETLPMKYGIVRNNIYRLSLNSITSLGLIIIEVRDWTPVRVPEIQM